MEYEGEYLCDKKWNGKGYNRKGDAIYELKDGKGKVKEYKEDELIFEGEYINGRRNGRGIEYYSKNKIGFEGEYLEGKQWNGKEIAYNSDGESAFSIDYTEGKSKINYKIIVVK